MTDEVATRLLEAIAANRLIILSGAGLSMADPSNVPSAASRILLAEGRVAAEESILDKTVLWSFAQPFPGRAYLEGERPAGESAETWCSSMRKVMSG